MSPRNAKSMSTAGPLPTFSILQPSSEYSKSKTGLRDLTSVLLEKKIVAINEIVATNIATILVMFSDIH